MSRPSTINLSLDTQHGVAYLALAPFEPKAVAHSVPLSDLAPEWPEIPTIGRFTLDFDAAGRLIGIEVFDPESSLSDQLLNEAD
jgi:hypothetical protein